MSLNQDTHATTTSIAGRYMVTMHRVLAYAEQIGAAIALAIVDDGGNLVGFIRHEDARLISCTTAIGKARCAVLFARDSSETVNIAETNPLAFQSFSSASNEDVTFVIGDGGYFIKGRTATIGAGVAGATGELDHKVGEYLKEELSLL